MRQWVVAGLVLFVACSEREADSPLKKEARDPHVPDRSPRSEARPDAGVPRETLPPAAPTPVREAVPPPTPPMIRAPEAPPPRNRATAYMPPPLRPWNQEPAPTSACFSLHTMDHLKAYVLINGERVTDTPCLWAFSRSYTFDPKIAVTEWPPKTAAFAGAAALRDESGRPGPAIEIAIEGGLYDQVGRDRLKKAYPHLEPGEQVLYVQAEILGQRHQGALRLKLVGEDGTFYRYTNFNPLQSMEDEMASRFGRSVWFQRERSE